jgi:hypothetical protein
MGRQKPNKPRRSRFQIDERPVDQAEMMAYSEQLMAQVDDHGRLLFMDDPALGFGQVATGITEQGEVTTDPGAVPMPVALFEPERSIMMQAPGEAPQEGQVEGAIVAGLRRIARGVVDIRHSEGWALHRLPDDRLELRSPDGGVYSRIAAPVDPSWISSAVEHGYVLCLYGPQLGVRLPPDRTPAQYSAADRLAEFRTARGRGLVAGGFVTFHNNRG